MLERLSGRWLTALALLLAGFFIIPSFLVLLGNGSGFSTAGRLFFALVGLSAGVAMLTGLAVGGRSPWLGAGLLAAGAVVMAVLWFWLFFILVPAALVVVTLSVVRARRETASRRPAQPQRTPAPP